MCICILYTDGYLKSLKPDDPNAWLILIAIYIQYDVVFFIYQRASLGHLEQQIRKFERDEGENTWM